MSYGNQNKPHYETKILFYNFFLFIFYGNKSSDVVHQWKLPYDTNMWEILVPSDVCKTMSLWRELKLHVTPPTHLFEDHIVYQMENIVGGLADKMKIILKELIKMVNEVKGYIVD